MTAPIVITLAGEPQGKARPRFAGHAFTPVKTRDYEAALKREAKLAMGDHPPLAGALKIEVHACFAWPLGRREHPTVKPDIDNILKMIDALNKVVWRDDAQIVEATVSKRYGDDPQLMIEVCRA